MVQRLIGLGVTGKASCSVLTLYVHACVDMAEEIMGKEMGLLAVPTGLPSIDDIDKLIEEKNKLKKK